MIDYDRALQNVRELRQIANELTRAKASRLRSIDDSVRQYWSGQAATEFLLKISEYQMEIESEVARINKLADDLEAAARKAQEATAALAAENG